MVEGDEMAKKKNMNALAEEPVVKEDIPEVVEVKEEVKEEIKEEPKPVTKVSRGKVVNCERLNVRKGPSTDTEVVNVLVVGTVVELVNKGKEWHRTKEGYVMSKYIKVM
ncbi:MAG: SH3 domain-containing protein [Pseudobutyrivibrio sp.]|nr:SH3 domain-containing protein [Pseudobutyrivibrio sp.]